MRAFFTIDVEQDCPPFRSTYRGVEQGLPKLAGILKQKNVLATFFVTGDVARRYPSIIRELVAAGHEIGCHGDTHARFDQMTLPQAEAEVRSATETLREFYPVVSFRAPNLQFPGNYLKLLTDHGYRLDSSEARHKRPWLAVRRESGILRVPVSTTSLVLRLSPFLRDLFLGRMTDPVVLFAHPWEYIDLQAEDLRFDCRWRTGAYSQNALTETITFFQRKGASFLPMNTILAKP